MSSILLIFSRKFDINRAAGAPSLAQWSKVRDRPKCGMNSTSAPFKIGFVWTAHTPRIATSGSFKTGVKLI